MLQTNFQVFQFVLMFLLDLLQTYLLVWFFVVLSGILFFRFFLSKEATRIIYFTKNEVEMFKAKNDTESVFGISPTKKDLVVFLKSKNVSPILYRTFGRIFRLWITVEGYPFVVNMNNLQDIAKKGINEQFFALFRKNTLPKIIQEVIKGEIKGRIIDIITGLMIGLVIGFFIVPFYLQFFGFIPS